MSVTRRIEFEQTSAPEVSPWRGSRVYWICQVAGWTLMFVLNQIGALTVMPFEWPQLLLNASLSVIGLGVTHTLRAVSRMRGWDRLATSALIVRIAGAIVACVAVTLVFVVALDALFDRLLPAAAASVLQLNWRAGAMVITAANMSGVYITWCGIYYGVRLLRRQQRAETERWKLQAALSAAELAALKAQLNPHFLFNALNGVRALVIENPPRAQEMVTRLAAILRYSLQASERETVSLGEELKMVEDYLGLEAIRFEQRLRVTRDIAPGAADAAVPPMIVQTLVENAIKHGISRNRSGGEIHLSAHVDDAALHLEVTNPGALAGDRNGTGTGLRNAAERIHRLWGGAASLQVMEEPGERVTARLRIPR